MKSKTQEAFARKWVGVVKFKSGDATVKFTSVETIKDEKGNEKPKLFPNGSVEMKVKLAELPKIGKRVIKPNMDGKQVRIRLTSDGDEVEEVGPVRGAFPIKLVSLGPKKEDSVPVPSVKWYNKGQKDENGHLQFFGVYEVQEGVFRGLQLPAYYLHYKFEGVPEDEEDGGMTRFDTVDVPNAKQLHKLQDWAEVQGNILDEPIAWNPEDVEDVPNEVVDFYTNEVTKSGDPKHNCEFANILPILEERALEADRDLQGIVENGYLNLVQAVEDYGSDDDAEEVEEDEPVKVPAKAPAKKVKDIADETEEEFEEKFPPKVKAPAKAAKRVKKSADEEDEDL